MPASSNTIVPVTLIVAGTICGLAATDLILPAIPMLPTVLAGSAEMAQWVLAAFALGTGTGLLLFGELGARFKIVNVLVASLFAFAVLSIAATLTSTLLDLSVVRFFQGISAAAPAVFAPVMVKRLYDERRAIVMIGRIGSIESMAPAIAPIIGVGLLSLFGWRSSFYVVAVVAALLGLGWLLDSSRWQRFSRLARVEEGYPALLANVGFLRYAVSQAGTLGAVLIIVFSAPKVLTSSMGGELSDFIVMQVLGITFFVISANMTGVFTRWWGDERTILIGSAMTAAGCAAILSLAALNVASIPALWFFFVFVNLGLGIRGPIGFFKALAASGDNESRGSALAVFLVMLFTALGTAAVARFIEIGLFPVGIAALAASALSVLLLLLTRPFEV